MQQIENLQATPPEAQSEPLLVTVGINDPECIEELKAYQEGRQRQEYVRSALKIGILALRQAKGRIDAETVRNEGEHILSLLSSRLDAFGTSTETQIASVLKNYFDPKDGRFNQRVESLIKNDGDLTQVIQAQMQTAERSLKSLLDAHLGDQSPLVKLVNPEESHALLAAIRANVDQVVTQQKDRILDEFSLDKKEGALSRLVQELKDRHGDLGNDLKSKINEVVQEFSLDNEGSALSRLVARVDEAQKRINSEFSLDTENSALSRLRKDMIAVMQSMADSNDAFQKNVLSTLNEMRIRKEEAARSTTHGNIFESEVFKLVQKIASKEGDIADSVGNTVGFVARSKVGDMVVELGADCRAAGARIVIEAKEDASYTLKESLAELDRAKENRQASVGIFIHSTKTAKEEIPLFARFGQDVVLRWDADDEKSDIVLVSALMVAKALAIRIQNEASHQSANISEMEQAILDLEKQISNFENIKTKGNSIISSANFIIESAEKMAAGIGKQAALLSENTNRLKLTGASSKT